MSHYGNPPTGNHTVLNGLRVYSKWAGDPTVLTNAAGELERLGALCAVQALEVAQLELAEEGAKEAFGHVVEQKRDLEDERNRLRTLLDAAYADIRRFARPPATVPTA